MPEISDPFSFTKGCRPMRFDSSPWPSRIFNWPTMLWDTQNDPAQLDPIEEQSIESRMTENMQLLLHEIDTPQEQYERLGL